MRQTKPVYLQVSRPCPLGSSEFGYIKWQRSTLTHLIDFSITRQDLCWVSMPRHFSYPPSSLHSLAIGSAQNMVVVGVSPSPTSSSSPDHSSTLSPPRLECERTDKKTMLGRAVIGCGVGIVKVAAPVLIQEIAHPRIRAILGSCYQTFAYFGIFFAAFMTFVGLYVPGNWGWRFPSLLQVVGPVAVLVVVALAPESPRWLIKNGREEQALEVLATYHANGDKSDPLVQLEMREIAAAIEREMTSKQAGYLDFLRTPGNRKRLLVLLAMALSLNWMGNGIITYYLSPILKSVGVIKPVQITLINAGLALWNLILAGTAAVFCDKFGRRPLFLTSTAGMLCSYVVVMGLSAGFAKTKQQSIGTAVIPFLFIYFGFYDIAFTPLPIAYTVEILPFNIRSKGMALFTSTATLGNAFNQFVNPLALKAISWKYYGVYVAILAFYLVFIFLVFPETKRLSAEEASRVFDQGRLRMSPKTRDVESSIGSAPHSAHSLAQSDEKPTTAKDLEAKDI
ncbi:hexose transporter [Cryptococcus gattii Ru294]|uniref:Hexose transporter protein, putative n=1 Tax=Cryptococcus gattii serotype B (strain WM276 / ATCC MYA-4071) TaxID=367775 RepID=E6RE25_CRYGW|nr:Hexose transporter protein, putative [Cryptococcus gattii WM276]ADV25061.1 Hexose transporter protein, putative [Cryptococcus gattii WM276]KIR51137.1 hexose transporter [Cryptococcus gattii Ru294]